MQSTRLFSSSVCLYVVVSFILLLASCTVVPKNYPKAKPFVFKYTVTVEGNFTTEEKSNLETKLGRQLDDSIRVRSVRKFLFINKDYMGFNRPVLNKPPVYDVSNIERSKIYMKALLVSLGYFKDTITEKIIFDTVRNDEIRTTVNFFVKPGRAVIIDSFRYNIHKPELQRLAVSTQSESFVKKGAPFAKTSISSELDRLVQLYRNNGYMRFGREELYGLWDTLDVSLLRPVTDPFEQLELLQKLKARRDSLTANLEIKLRPTVDTTKLTRYYVGNIKIYPDYIADPGDSTFTVIGNDTVISYQNLFLPRILPPNLYLQKGDIYDQRNYYRTISRFNQLGSWRMVSIEPLPRAGQDTTDFVVKMNPAKKYSFTANLEGSRNNNAVSGNLFGIGVNFSLQNRNFAKRANLTNTNIRVGVETGRDTATDIKFIQTRQLSIGHTIFFPRIVFPYRLLFERLQKQGRSVLSLNGSLTDRRGLYNLNTVNIAGGIDWSTTTGWDFSLRWPNVEYSSLTSQPRLDSIFQRNPSLRNIFNDGLIVSIKGGATRSIVREKKVSILRLNVEMSGIPGFLRSKFFDSALYRFVKVDAEYIQKTQVGNGELVLRFFGGLGNELTSTIASKKKYNLPFFRQYFAGGPNSMRAWALRKLGPGSLIQTYDTTGIPDRFGDIHLETNIEYRFKFFKLAGIPFNGAVFTDIGNVWLMRKPPGGYDETVFSFNRLAKDIAVGMGFGLRADFSILVLRLDFSHKVKDPSPVPAKANLQNKWFGYLGKSESPLRHSQFQLGISYPFIR